MSKRASYCTAQGQSGRIYLEATLALKQKMLGKASPQHGNQYAIDRETGSPNS